MDHGSDDGIGKQTRNYGNYRTLVPEMKKAS